MIHILERALVKMCNVLNIETAITVKERRPRLLDWYNNDFINQFVGSPLDSLDCFLLEASISLIKNQGSYCVLTTELRML
jgi:hypothetical protein